MDNHTQTGALDATGCDNSELLPDGAEIYVSPNGSYSNHLAPASRVEIGSGIELQRFEPPIVRVPENLRVLGVRNDIKNSYLTLRDVSSGRNIELDLVSPRKLAARLAPYFGDKFPSAILHAYAMKMVLGARDLGDLKKLSDGVTILGDDRGVIVSAASTTSFGVGGHWPVFRQEIMPIVDERYLADPHRGDWLGFTVDELNQPPLYGPREAFEILFGLLYSFKWADLADTYVHALLPFHLYLHTHSATKVLVNLSGPKSLTTLFLEFLYLDPTGDDFALVPVVPVEPATFGTVRALIPNVGNLPLLVMHDEDDLLMPSGYSSNSRKVKERKPLTVPIISATDQDYDPRMWLTTQVLRNPHVPEASQVVREYLAGINQRELRRSILIDSISILPMVVEAANRLGESPSGKILQLPAALQKVNLHLSAVGSALGSDGTWVSGLLADRSLNLIQQEKELDIGQMLLSTLLHGHFEYIEGHTRGGMPQRVPTTLATLLNGLSVGEEMEVVEVGCVLERTSLSERLVYAHWESTIKGPFYGTQFSRMTPTKLSRMSRTARGWVENSAQKPISGVQERCTLFRDLMTE